jgi:hypothetical protein
MIKKVISEKGSIYMLDKNKNKKSSVSNLQMAEENKKNKKKAMVYRHGKIHLHSTN